MENKVFEWFLKDVLEDLEQAVYDKDEKKFKEKLEELVKIWKAYFYGYTVDFSRGEDNE